MDRNDLNDLLHFMAVAEERSFTRAAVRLGTSQSTLSHTIKQLEERLGFRLLMRTTRSVSPTEAGERLLQSMVPRIRDIEGEIEALREDRNRPSGTVRLSVSDHSFTSVIWPKLKKVLKRYPDINVEMNLDNGFRDIVAERFDAGVRLGDSVDKDMIAVRIGPDWRLVAVASPGYLADHPAPLMPQELVHHNCINHRQRTEASAYAWEFAKDGEELRVKVTGQLTFNVTPPMIDAVLQGYGIAFVAEDLVADHIAAGRLVQVLDEWSPYFAGYYLYYPSRRQNSAAFSVVLNALRETVS
jgi:DNA-binding transcriptional LysR family regulator